MFERLQQVKKEIAALKAEHYFLLDKEELSKSEQYKMDNFEKELTRLETRYKTIVTALGNASAPYQYQVSVKPAQVLKDLLGFDLNSSEVNFRGSSITSDGGPTGDITDIVPLMRFVCREEPAKLVYNVLDEYLDWKEHETGEKEKNIKFITVVGTSGKGKTTFARRFMDLPYSGRHPDIVNDWKECNRSYRVSCTEFDTTKDPETQLSLLVLYEAFKNSASDVLLGDFLDGFDRNFSGRLIFADILEVITKTFITKLSDDNRRKLLMIINLDETNALLDSGKEKEFFQELMHILRNTSTSFNLLTILSGTYSNDLFEQFQFGQYKFVDIGLSMIELEASKEVILGMTANPHLYNVSPHLEYILTLCGGVGRYLEIAIIQMSILGSAQMDGKVIKGFNLNAYEYFLNNLQTPQYIQTLLENLTNGVLSHYPKVFSRFAQSIELLACYTLFQWPVHRGTIINKLSVGNLEKEGLVFLQPRSAYQKCLSIPFIALYWTIKYSNQNVQIPFLKDIKSYFYSDQSKNNSLHILMAKL